MDNIPCWESDQVKQIDGIKIGKLEEAIVHHKINVIWLKWPQHDTLHVLSMKTVLQV